MPRQADSLARRLISYEQPLNLTLRLFQLEIVSFVSALIYFVYTLMMVFTFWLLTGTIGFYATYYFVRKIYGAVKID